MKVLTIGTDRKLFEEKSSVLDRAISYSSLVEELHIIVCTIGFEHKYRKVGNLHIHPTNSWNRWFYIFDIYNIGKKIIPKFGFVRGLSVITTQDPFECGLSGLFLSKKFRIPIYLQSHTDFLTQTFKESFLNRIRIFIAGFVIPRSNGMRVVSSELKESVIKKFPNIRFTPDVLPIYVDIQYIEKYIPNPEVSKIFERFKFAICMVSRLSKEKNIETALKAFASVFKNFRHIGMVIVGDGKERKNLENLSDKLGIKNNVIFVGWKEDVISFYKFSQMFLTTSSYEGYGMTIIEAGASGIPIVTTQVGIAKEICKDGINSLVCQVGDIECFERAINKLVSENHTRQILSDNMKEHLKSKSGDMNSYAVSYIENLKKLLQK